jgi:hypothetical protein
VVEMEGTFEETNVSGGYEVSVVLSVLSMKIGEVTREINSSCPSHLLIRPRIREGAKKRTVSGGKCLRMSGR